MDFEKTKRAIALFALLLLLPLRSTAMGQLEEAPYHKRGAWYESLAKRFNPSHRNYGEWIEERRRAFLEATVGTPYFWYSFAMTIGLLSAVVLCVKFHSDNRKRMQLAADMMADLYTHDLYSRQAARDAITRHNQHMELCNRQAEEEQSPAGRPGWGRSPVEKLRAELQQTATQLDAVTQERNKLQEDLRRQSLVVADLSLQIDALSRKINGAANNEGSASRVETSNRNDDAARMVGHVNHLREQLYVEQQKNRRLKGA